MEIHVDETLSHSVEAIPPKHHGFGGMRRLLTPFFQGPGCPASL